MTNVALEWMRRQTSSYHLDELDVMLSVRPDLIRLEKGHEDRLFLAYKKRALMDAFPKYDIPTLERWLKHYGFEITQHCDKHDPDVWKTWATNE